MIRLLPEEEPIADLRLGLIQTITEDIFTGRTMVLTNKRLWLLKKRLFSNSTSVVFLKDITTIEARRTIELARAIVAVFFVLWGLSGLFGSFVMIAQLGNREAGLAVGIACCLAIPLLSVGIWFALNVASNSVFIYTSMKPIQFRLALSFSTKQIEGFVNRVQSAMMHYKR